jgi:hypothetical protein
MEALVVAAIGNILTVISLVSAHVTVRAVIESKLESAVQKRAFTKTPIALYLRKEWKDHHRITNVYDGNGKKVYTIERKSRFFPFWSVLDFPSRKEIATVHTGLVDHSVDFHFKSNIQHREMIPEISITGYKRNFYLDDGATYTWSRASRYLEKVINPGRGHEEVRVRVARARLMRQFRFDYEVLIDDTKVDREIVLATAFMCMICDWGKGHKTRTTGPSYFPKFIKRSSPLQSRPETTLSQKQVDHTAIIPFEPLTIPHQISDQVYLVLEPTNQCEPESQLQIVKGKPNMARFTAGDSCDEEVLVFKSPSTHRLAKIIEIDTA